MKTILKELKMTLKQQTQIGLTFGQIISIIGLVGAMMLVWSDLNVKIANNEVKIEQLEKGRVQNAINIETTRIENRDDHKEMIRKLDLLLTNKK